MNKIPEAPGFRGDLVLHHNGVHHKSEAAEVHAQVLGGDPVVESPQVQLPRGPVGTWRDAVGVCVLVMYESVDVLVMYKCACVCVGGKKEGIEKETETETEREEK